MRTSTHSFRTLAAVVLATIEGTQSTVRGGRDYEMKLRREPSLSKDGQILTVNTSLQMPTGPIGIKQSIRMSDQAGTSGKVEK